MKIARRSHVDPFIVMDVLARANRRAEQGLPVYHLEAGQPGCPAPRLALDAAAAALRAENLGYTEALGRPALRQRLSKYYAQTHHLEVPPERIILTTGSSAGFILAFLAAFDPGQRLAMATPGYPAYRNTARAVGLEPVLVRTGPNDQFRLHASALKELGAFDGVLVASPANPTGTMLGRDELADIAALCAARGAWLISDEIYHGISFEAAAVSALAVAPDAIVINSFSKYYAMTGWRIGWMVVPEALVRPIERLAQNLFISPPTISQVAALAALDAGGELEEHVRLYASNRATLLAALREIGLKIIAPADGAFYVYGDITPLGLDSESLSRTLLDETGVAATPGLDFDQEQGRNWMRFSYAGSRAEVTAGAEALVAWCRKRRGL